MGFQDVFLAWEGAFVAHSAYCRLVIAEDPSVCEVLFFFFFLFYFIHTACKPKAYGVK